MSDTTNIRRSANSIVKQNSFDGYSKVVVVVSDEIEYSAGTDTGLTLTVNSPWGTQAMANRLLEKARGFQYQPFDAQGATLDPAAELGDGITAGKLYSGIYQKNVSLGPLYTADVSAPGGERINYKYEYKSPAERRVERQGRETRASLRLLADRIDLEVQERKAQGEQFTGQLAVQADKIAAKVEKTGGESGYFAWDMEWNKHVWIASGKEVVRFDPNGAKITGEIIALSGKIGGFDIRGDYLSYNNQTWGGTNSYGVYMGQSGIQCGHTDYGFRVTPDGRLYATEGYFRGSVSANRINYGGNDGYFDGGGLWDHSVGGGKVGYNTISTANTSGGINTSLGYADYANGVFNGWNRASNIYANSVTVTGSLYVPSNGSTRRVGVRTLTINGYVYNFLTV